MNRPLMCLLLLLALATSPLAHARNGSQPPSEVGVFDYYLLSLSWSPTFCLTRANNPQCTGKGYGFVLHGLWPQADQGPWPQNCEAAGPLRSAERDLGRTLFPTERLMNHEWKKHGTCSGLGGLGYFEHADKALAAVKIPAALEPPTSAQSLDAEQIVELFQRSNPGLPANAITLQCKGPELSEVRVCLTKDLAFRACAANVRSQCRKGELRIPAVR